MGFSGARLLYVTRVANIQFTSACKDLGYCLRQTTKQIRQISLYMQPANDGHMEMELERETGNWKQKLEQKCKHKVLAVVLLAKCTGCWLSLPGISELSPPQVFDCSPCQSSLAHGNRNFIVERIVPILIRSMINSSSLT